MCSIACDFTIDEREKKTYKNKIYLFITVLLLTVILTDEKKKENSRIRRIFFSHLWCGWSVLSILLGHDVSTMFHIFCITEQVSGPFYATATTSNYCWHKCNFSTKSKDDGRKNHYKSFQHEKCRWDEENWVFVADTITTASEKNQIQKLEEKTK